MYRKSQTFLFFFSSRRRHTIYQCDWSSDVCSSDLSWRSPSASACWLRSPNIDCSGAPRGRSEERRVGKSVDLGGRRIIKKKNREAPGRSAQRRTTRDSSRSLGGLNSAV